MGETITTSDVSEPKQITSCEQIQKPIASVQETTEALIECIQQPVPKPIGSTIEETPQPSSEIVTVLQPSPADIDQIVMTDDDKKQQTPVQNEG